MQIYKKRTIRDKFGSFYTAARSPSAVPLLDACQRETASGVFKSMEIQ
jgi:hypothetical protein